MIKLITSGVLIAAVFMGLYTHASDLPAAPRPQKNPPPKVLSAEERADLMALKIRAGALIKVLSYDKKKKSFSIQIVNEPAVGPNITTLPDLLKASGQPRTSRQMTNPESWVGREFKLVEDLRLIMP